MRPGVVIEAERKNVGRWNKSFKYKQEKEKDDDKEERKRVRRESEKRE
jgi:hypothetical protein